MNEKVKVIGLILAFLIGIILFWGSLVYIVSSMSIFYNAVLTLLLAHDAYKEDTNLNVYLARVSFLWTMFISVKYFI